MRAAIHESTSTRRGGSSDYLISKNTLLYSAVGRYNCAAVIREG